jgi:hypothetical protein
LFPCLEDQSQKKGQEHFWSPEFAYLAFKAPDPFFELVVAGVGKRFGGAVSVWLGCGPKVQFGLRFSLKQKRVCGDACPPWDFNVIVFQRRPENYLLVWSEIRTLKCFGSWQR